MHGYEQHLMGLVVGHHIHTTGGPLAFSAFREGFLADQARRFVAVRNPVNSAEEGDKQQLITGPLADNKYRVLVRIKDLVTAVRRAEPAIRSEGKALETAIPTDRGELHRIRSREHAEATWCWYFLQNTASLKVYHRHGGSRCGVLDKGVAVVVRDLQDGVGRGYLSCFFRHHHFPKQAQGRHIKLLKYGLGRAVCDPLSVMRQTVKAGEIAVGGHLADNAETQVSFNTEVIRGQNYRLARPLPGLIQNKQIRPRLNPFLNRKHFRHKFIGRLDGS